MNTRKGFTTFKLKVGELKNLFFHNYSWVFSPRRTRRIAQKSQNV